jgi:hypothetical protein
MSRLDELPPDQRAALSLLLRQRKSYAEVATLLGISELAVHDRAHAALAVLAPRRARELTPERRLEVGDYLLGQQAGVAERLRTRTFLSGSEPARAWATEVAAELAPLGGEQLSEIPPAVAAAPSAPAPQRVADLSSPSSSAAPPGVPGAASVAPGRSQSSSRIGGAVLLAVLIVAVIVAVVLFTGNSGSSNSGTTASKTVSTSSTATKAGPTIDNKITLKPSEKTSHTSGVVYVLSEGSTLAYFIQVQHIPASKSKGFYYAVWLYNSPSSSLPLSKSPAVGSTHAFAGGSRLPSNASGFHEILLTKETKAHPTHPGAVILRGSFSLH